MHSEPDSAAEAEYRPAVVPVKKPVAEQIAEVLADIAAEAELRPDSLAVKRLLDLAAEKRTDAEEPEPTVGQEHPALLSLPAELARAQKYIPTRHQPKGGIFHQCLIEKKVIP